MKLLSNLGRCKVRTGLTILGITIGIWSLVVFGSMANKINALVAGGSDYYRDKVMVSAKGGFMGIGGPMDIALGDRIAAQPGVDVVLPEVGMMLSGDASTVSMSVPDMIASARAGRDQGRETLFTQYSSGRALSPDDQGQVVTLGSSLALKFDKHVGDTIELRGVPFTVVGILAPTLSAPDDEALVPLVQAQRLYLQTLPPLVADKLDPATIATGFTVYLKSGASPNTVAAEIDSSISDVSTMTGKDFDKQIGSAMSVLNAILVGIALISLVVGGLSVINTMYMSIAERTREIGIKRAIGASRIGIVREFVTESAFIGFIGGALGLVLGAAVVCFADEAGRSSGTVLFQLTTGTAVSAVVFSTVLGALAGFVPALHAARLDPVSALRYE
ncbi:MAG: ABC transporter permease [Candidatus Limnocylindrales bacterium]|jgi:putative ABC transport system permease protein